MNKSAFVIALDPATSFGDERVVAFVSSRILACIALVSLAVAACIDDSTSEATATSLEEEPATTAPAAEPTTELIGSPEPAEPATFDDLAGEWRATPLIVSDAVLQEMEEKCLADAFPIPGVSLVVADARGEGRVDLILAREDRQHGTCETIVTSDGQIESHLTSNTGEPVSDPPVEATGLDVWGGQNSPSGTDPEDRWRQIRGEAGTEIHGVVAHVSGLPPIVASLSDGWFSLWHPAARDVQWNYRLVGLDAEGNEVTQVLG